MELQQSLLDAFKYTDIAPWDDELFNDFALKLFHYQYEHNEIYRDFCHKLNVSDISDYHDIPAVPTDAFKYAKISTSNEITRTFRTSGTTLGRRGEHHFHTLDFYKAAINLPFDLLVMFGAIKIRLMMLVPKPSDLPDSSLSFMMGEIYDNYGTDKSDFYVKVVDGNLEFEFDRFSKDLDDAVKSDEPVLVMGTAFALVEFLDQTNASWELPEGSRLLETGGLKGRTREVNKEEMYTMFKSRFGIGDYALLSEYSMTELSSQAYTDNLAGLKSWRNAHYVAPPWMRVEPVDPKTLTPIPLGDAPVSGLLRIYDLANVDSVLSLQTFDLGTVFPDFSFTLHGRATGADLRGCSLTVEEILEKLK